MPSAALVEWQTHRTGRIAELFAARGEITGRGRDLRRTQLNEAERCPDCPRLVSHTSELCRKMDSCVATYIGRVTGGERPW